MIAASAVHGTATRINGSVNIGSIASVGNARLQRKQIRHVPAFHGQGLDLCLTECVSHGRVCRINDRGFAGDLHSLRGRAHLEFWINRRGRVNEQLDLLLLHFAEARHLDCKLVGPRL